LNSQYEYSDEALVCEVDLRLLFALTEVVPTLDEGPGNVEGIVYVEGKIDEFEDEVGNDEELVAVEFNIAIRLILLAEGLTRAGTEWE
jgi:hypothetical protein